MRIVFSRCVWMKYYKGNYDNEDYPPSDSYQVGSDTENFKPTPIGPEGTREFYCFGYSEHGARQLADLDIGRIAGQSISNNVESIDDVLVVFFATSPNRSGPGSYVVGWYNNATAYRKCQVRKMNAGTAGDYTSYFYFAAKRDDCVLLPLNKRDQKDCWIIPSGLEKVATFGAGQDGIWYADEVTKGKGGTIDDLNAFKIDIIHKINNYNGDNWINKYHD